MGQGRTIAFGCFENLTIGDSDPTSTHQLLLSEHAFIYRNSLTPQSGILTKKNNKK